MEYILAGKNLTCERNHAHQPVMIGHQKESRLRLRVIAARKDGLAAAYN
ncbi:MAG: hypothetical protein OXC63_01340 [Aestuariivita sp.]|nr:hypothetical protein [Aestuariivita sp.]